MNDLRTRLEDILGAGLLDNASAFAPLIRRPIERDGRSMERETQLFLKIVALAGRPPIHTQTPAEARAQYVDFLRMSRGPSVPMARRLDLNIQADDRFLPLRIVFPKDTRALAPVILYFHGGGFLLGDIDTDDAFCRRLARATGAAVASLAYRLAPEHPFPAAVKDIELAYRFLLAQGLRLGLDPARIAVAGTSAGGTLAAVLCQLARDARLPAPRHQLLIYPLTDPAYDDGSRRSCAEGFFLETATVDYFNRHYLSGARGDYRAAPLRRPDLSGLPSATVLTAGFDPLRDEGERYAARLAAAGVEVTHIEARGSIHHFALLPTLPEGQRVMTEAAKRLAEALEVPHA